MIYSNLAGVNKHTYAMTITIKSNQFHGSLRNVNCPTQNPLAVIFISASKVYIPVKTYLLKQEHQLLP